MTDEGTSTIELEWSYELISEYEDELGRQMEYLDADPCPKCGGVILNTSIERGAQFVGASGKSKERCSKDPERQLYQLDDGAFNPELVFAQCSKCQTVLYDKHE